MSQSQYSSFLLSEPKQERTNPMLNTLTVSMEVCSLADYGAFHNKVAEEKEEEEDRRQLVSSLVLEYLKAKKCPRDFKEDYEEIREVQVQHYCTSQKILLVGEGDFSFSASLALAFASASNMVATSLDSREFLCRNYKKAMENIHELRSRGCSIIHGLDATEMAQHADLKGMLFDRIIFNFPHAGFFPAESSESQIRRHQMLVLLFLENAKKMIKEGGEIHVTHKSWGFFKRWNLEILALNVGLRLIEEVPFNFIDYPGYRTKYGFGGDKNFNCDPSKTYKFGYQSQTTITALNPCDGWDCDGWDCNGWVCNGWDCDGLVCNGWETSDNNWVCNGWETSDNNGDRNTQGYFGSPNYAQQNIVKWRPPSNKSRSPVICKLCDKYGHRAKVCRSRPLPSSHPQADVHRPKFGKWPVDFGLSDHITSDLQNLSMNSEYGGDDEVEIGKFGYQSQTTITGWE